MIIPNNIIIRIKKYIKNGICVIVLQHGTYKITNALIFFKKNYMSTPFLQYFYNKF